MIQSNRLAIYAIGKIKKLWIRDGINQYKKRMPELVINELKTFNLNNLRSNNNIIICLSEEGKQFNSVELGSLLLNFKNKKINFLIGDSDGISLDIKKNLDKLNKFKKKKNLNNESKNINNYTNITNNDNLITNPLNSEDPNKIFYSLIDNSESLEETSNVNNSLRKSELNQINIKSKNANFSKKLTAEEELYDEFNYLLDE